MKKAILLSALVLSSFSVLANGNTGSTTWDLEGTVDKRCTVGSKGNSAIDIMAGGEQSNATINVWCNYKVGLLSTSISSKNKGALKAKHGLSTYTIPYELTLGGHTFDFTSGSEEGRIFKILDWNGIGDGDNEIDHTFTVKPTLNGREYAGDYKDTITINVAAN
ncbi:hypothetical protein L4D20_11905 [Vibrio kyushuensis]|uniref:hypothetical protein n=1 Tax=Vibrio kyushuensis TaxID=2910249 RepID=UPI003D143F95